MSDPMYLLVMAAAELKLAAPQEYERLIKAVKIFEDRCRDDLQAAEPNVIFPAQGKAQVITQLRQKLESCIDLRAKFEARKT
jgi:hypothetical protein